MSEITTFTGKRFDPWYMKEEDVSVLDIAHALSLICKYNGQIKYFYSIGQHLINCVNEAEARHLSDRICLSILLSEAYIAYLGDIVLPVKSRLQEYHQIKEQIEDVILEKFSLFELSEEELKYMKKIDDDMKDNEMRVLKPGEEHKECVPLSSKPDLEETDRRKVEIGYMHLINRYTARLQ